MKGRLSILSRTLGYRFTDIRLLEEAMTHPSALPGRGGSASDFGYERLEFLGDRVLGLCVAAMLFRHFPNENEGELARRHAALVRREALARIAVQLGIEAALVLSKGEEDCGGRRNQTILADACEAVLGAIYADGGLADADRLVRHYWTPLMAEALNPPKDGKTALQEWAQGLGKPLPVYRVLKTEGPSHDPSFLVSVEVEGVEPATGQGSSKRAAEQAAAAVLLGRIA